VFVVNINFGSVFELGSAPDSDFFLLAVGANFERRLVVVHGHQLPLKSALLVRNRTFQVDF
jgi:hypothetical protein